jgi:hypothetical protein
VALGVGWAAFAERRSGLEAIEAARLGAEAERMEGTLRLAHLRPAHDLTPVYAEIRATVEALRSAGGRAGAAARAFAVGRGLQLLGEAEGARASLEEAWSLGFQRPEAALALGLLDGERYARERAGLPRIDDPRRKAERIAVLRARWRDPAVARLRLVPAATEADRALLEARIALVEERWLDAAALSRSAQAAGADPLESGTLEGEALLRRALEVHETRDVPGTLSPLAEAKRVLRSAADIGRSAPRPRLLLAQVLMTEANVRLQREPPRAGLYRPAMEVLGEALALDPGNPELLVARSEIEAEQGRMARQLGADPGPELAAAVASADAATRAAPGMRSAWERLAWSCLNFARELRDARYEVRWAWEKGIAAATRAEALAPESSVPPSLLSQMHADRAETTEIGGGDARDDVRAALAAARRVLEIGDRPVVSRILLAQALRQEATSRFGRGEDAEASFAEAAGVLAEAFRYGENQIVAGFGVQIGVLWAEAGLLEGRVPRAALAAVEPWAAALEPRAGGDLIASAQLGELAVLQAAAAVRAGRDPGPDLARATRLLEPVVKAGVYPPARGRLGEGELTRAAWLASRGRDPGPALAAAGRHARAMKSADPASPDGWRLEAEEILLRPAPTRGDLRRARSALSEALSRLDGDARLIALRGLAELRAGDAEAARTSLAEAERRNGRLAWVAELRARVRGVPATTGG